MDIVVHGTKGGRQIFTPNKLGGLVDVNSDSSKASAIGQEAFAIRFIEKTIIFSKYKIIRDVRGDKRTGFIAFSLFLPNNKKLHGTDILSVLNKVSEEYCKRYIPENDNNLKDVREEWGFLENILKEYRIKSKDINANDIENMMSGTKDDAFIYYEIDKLQIFFDAPYKDEFSQYRQVLFVKGELKDKPESPLNALRHSENPNDNLTGKIDLDKKEYALRNYDGQANDGIFIEIKVKGKLLYKNCKINNKDHISIRYFRKYYKELIVEDGRLNDERIRRYLFVDEENRKINVEKNIDLDPVKKTITFEVKDWKEVPMYGSQITCKNAAGDEKLINSSNQVEFIGEEIGMHWTVSVNKGRLFAVNRPIDFERDCPGETSIVSIKLNKHKLEIIAHEGTLSSDPIEGKIEISKEEFIDSEIEKPNKITVSCTGYKPLTFEYHPQEHKEPYHLALQKHDTIKTKIVHIFTATPGMHGTWTDGSSVNINTLWSSGSDLVDKIKPHKRWRFTRFVQSGDMLIAKYERKGIKFENPKVIALAIVLAIVIGFSFWALFTLVWKEESKKPHQPTVQHIKDYIEGDSLVLDTLNRYKESLDEGHKEVLNSLDYAIKKREFINSWNFDSLKKMDYYPAQQNFKTTIENVDSTLYNDIKKRLGNVSSWSMDQIKDSIKAVLNITKPATENKREVEREAKMEKKEEPKKEVTQPARPELKKEELQKEIKQPTKPEHKKEEKPVPLPANTNNSKDISKELQSGTVTKDELEDWRSANMDIYKKSIALYLEFWHSIKPSMKIEESRQLLNKINADKHLRSSVLQSFLKSVCASKESFKKYNETPGKASCNTINDLISKVK